MGKTFRRAKDEDERDYRHDRKKQRKIAKVERERRMNLEFYEELLNDIKQPLRKSA